MANAKAKNEPTKDETTAVTTVVNGVTDERPDWLEKGSAGNEGVGAEDMILPRIDVLQDLSPQIKKSKPEYIEGAAAGMIFNTVTGTLYGNDVTIVPVLFRKEWVIFKNRDAGGGFVGAYPTEDDAEVAHARLDDPDDHEVVESHQHFVLVIPEKGPLEQAVMSMTKSKIKTSRSLNTLVQAAGVDRFAKAYKVEAVEDSGDKGDYWSLRVKPVGFVTREIYNEAKTLYEAIKSGAVGVGRDTGGDAPTDGVGGPTID